MADHKPAGPKTPWWHPARFGLRQSRLEARARIAKAVRGYFDGQDFLEVETPALQVSPGLEPHLRAVSATLHEPFSGGQTLYLHTSPEFAMKKLLAAGLPRIFQLAHAYRDGERSALHHPEFTMLEWYRATDGIEPVISDCVKIVQAAAQAAGVETFARNGVACNPFADWERLTVAEAFARDAGIDLFAAMDDPADPDPAKIKSEARRIGVAVGESDRFEDVFFRILLARIEPNLGRGRPTVLYDYPLFQAALARPKPNEPRVAERFEIYVCGVELANGCAELTDAVEQRRRFEHDIALKQRLYGVQYPRDEDFLAALDHGLPDCAGVAMGFDRLAMLATGAESIEDVLWAPVAGPKT